MESTDCRDGDGGVTGPLFLIPQHQLFLIEGVATIGLAIIFAFILPNSPKTVRGHAEQEREWLAWTFGQDQDHSDEITAWKGFEMAMADSKTWLLMAPCTA